jgi:hypothetical protein
MADKFDKLEGKIDHLVDMSGKQMDKLHDHDIKLSEYNGLLDVHIKRTELLEEQVTKVEENLEPVRDHVKGMKYVKKAILFGGTLLGIVFTVFKVLKVI